MNKIGIYYAYWTHNWDVDFVPFVGKVKRLGFDILEVNSGTVTNMSNVERDRLKSAAQKAGIELTFCIGLTRDYDLASEDVSVRQKGIEFLKKQIRMMKYIEVFYNRKRRHKTLGYVSSAVYEEMYEMKQERAA